MFNLRLRDTAGENFSFERCTLMMQELPAHLEDYVKELMSSFGSVLQVSLRRKEEEASWALVTFTHPNCVAEILKLAATDPDGRVSIRGNRYANMAPDEVVWLLPKVVDAEAALKSTGAFGRTWLAARKQAQENMTAEKYLCAFGSSNYQPEVIRHLKMRWLQKGCVLWEAGDLSYDCVYFLVAGCLDVTSGRCNPSNPASSDGTTVINSLHCGATFGDVAVLGDYSMTGGKRTAGIRAASDVAILSLSRIDYLRLTGEYSHHAVRALRQEPHLRNVMENSLLKNIFDGCGLYGSKHSSTFTDRIARASTHVHVKKNEILFKQVR